MSVDHNQRMRIGDIYMLTMDDVQAIMNSEQFTGVVCLCDPDDVSLESWVTITISGELRAQILMRSPRLM